MIDFNKILIRCSSIGKIMTEPKTKAAKEAGELSETAKNYLEELYIELKYSRKKEFGSKYIDKGLQQEEAGITLYCLEQKKFLRKNAQRINNDFLTGEPDLFIGEKLVGSEEGADIKNSWSIHTFPMFDKVLNKDYEYQNHGYMAITGAKKWTTVYTLCNCSADQIMNEKRMAFYALGQPADNDPVYKAKCIEIEKNMIFDMAQFKKDYPGYDLDCTDWRYDIPRGERVKEFPVYRDEEIINAIYAQVGKCRKHMEATFNDHIIIASHDYDLQVTIVGQG